MTAALSISVQKLTSVMREGSAAEFCLPSDLGFRSKRPRYSWGACSGQATAPATIARPMYR
jgi:hypothetical protein